MARGDKVDGSGFFRALEVYSRDFLKWYEEKSRGNPAQYPKIMSVPKWWARYHEWEQERLEEHKDGDKQAS